MTPRQSPQWKEVAGLAPRWLRNAPGSANLNKNEMATTCGIPHIQPGVPGVDFPCHNEACVKA
jgi:hypothetical protein